MRDYVIFTDSSADFPAEEIDKLGLGVIQLDVVVEGEEAKPNNEIDVKEIYSKLRAKKTATTSAASIEKFIINFEKALEKDVDILYLGFSFN